MPNNTSYADIIRDWEKLLASVQGDAVTLPTAESHRLALQKCLAPHRCQAGRGGTYPSQPLPGRIHTCRVSRERFQLGD